MTPILANTYFSGAGLMDIGLQAGELTLQQSFEIQLLCCDTLRRNFDHEVVQSDITKKLVSSEKECDVMVATYPCTRYSPIGDIHGVRTGDDLLPEEPSLTVGLLPRCSGTWLFEDRNCSWLRMFRG
jgi:DNA (cytosine-5)-methyltransferase 1